MEVIGASWGRTGTTSAAAALDLLGFGPCGQLQTMCQQPDLAEVWNRHHAGERVEWGVLDRERTIALYETHVEPVRAACPADRLIQWRVADDWPVLREGAGVPIPAEPVPHLRQREHG